MKTRSTRRSRRAATPALMLALLAGLTLAACGSSSSSSPTSGTARAASTSPAGGSRSARFTAIRECLKKQGIELPQRKPGQGGGGFFGGGGNPGTGPQLPSGVTRARFEAALKQCGGGVRRGGFGVRTSSPAFKAALASLAKCMAQDGVNLPAPNTSGTGPVFDTSKINVNSAQFKAAYAKCASLVHFARPGRGPGGAPGSGPGAGGPSGEA